MEQLQLTVIRGNISEIKTLANGNGTTKGVDADVTDKVADDTLDEAILFVKNSLRKAKQLSLLPVLLILSAMVHAAT